MEIIDLWRDVTEEAKIPNISIAKNMETILSSAQLSISNDWQKAAEIREISIVCDTEPYRSVRYPETKGENVDGKEETDKSAPN